MVGGAVMEYLGGLLFWWPKITGQKYPEMRGRLGALLIFVGFNMTFFPQFLLGYMGMPRRRPLSVVQVVHLRMSRSANKCSASLPVN